MSDQNPLEPRVRSLEQIAQTLTTLLVRADERMDQHEAWINQLGETQAGVESNLAALTQIVIDLGRAQTRNEKAANERMDQHEAWVNQLGETQARVENNLAALTQIVADLGSAQTRSEGAQARIENNLAALTEIVADLGRAQT